MLLRKLHLCLLGATLATAAFTTGCQSAPPAETVSTQPAQPAQDGTVIYNKWETETKRPHKEIAQRTPDEQKEYHDWRQKQPNVH